MNQPKVSVIILNWNGLEDTTECLESMKKISYSNYDVIVVDNASSGDDVRTLRDGFEGYIHIIQNDKNYGFAEGSNIGMGYALKNSDPAYILLLNNDTVVAPNFLDELVRVAESEANIGIVGAKIYYYDFEGRKDVIWFAGGKIEWWRRWIYPHIGWQADDLPHYQRTADVEWVSGAAMMIRASLITELSLLDSHYFLGNEDIEYCLKTRRRGFRIVYVPTARIWHKVGTSRNKGNAPAKGHEPSFVNLPSYYRLIRRNFSLPIYIYHLLLLPAILGQWGISYVLKRRDKRTLVAFIKTLLPGQHP
jgi:GT2 family glycosyltransferase